MSKEELKETIMALQHKIDNLQTEVDELEEQNWPRRKYMYLHSEKSDNAYNWESEWKFPGECPSDFLYALEEVKFVVDIYRNGKVKIVRVEYNKQKLEEK